MSESFKAFFQEKTGEADLISAHIENTSIHVTPEDKQTWGSAATELATHEADTDVHVTSQDKTAWNGAVSDLATHKDDTDVHVTPIDKIYWNTAYDHVSQLPPHVSSTDRDNWNGAVTGLSMHETNTTVHVTSQNKTYWNGAVSDIGDLTDLDTEDKDDLVSAINETVGEIGDLKSDLQNKANVDGSYENMTVGDALQLVSTVGQMNKVPYLFRTTGGSVDVGDRVKLQKIVGGTIAWNQLVKHNVMSLTYAQKTYDSETGITTVTPTDYTKTTSGAYWSGTVLPGHKALFFASVNPSGNASFSTLKGTGTQYIAIEGNKWTDISVAIYNDTLSAKACTLYVRPVASEWTNETFQFKNEMCIDLTQMFGSTIADYIYTLESTTEGSGIAKLKEWGFFTKPYYADNAGTLLSVNASEHNEIGFNQWDEEWEVGGLNSTTGEPEANNNRIRSKNFCQCLPNTAYYCRIGTASVSLIMYWYDANKNFISRANITNEIQATPANAYYFKLQTYDTLTNHYNTYKNDICINLAWDNSRNGEYEPYVKHSYPLDSDLTLRGIPKLDANNELYYDGDEYEADGTVTRNWNIIDLSSLDYTYEAPDTGHPYGYFTNKTISDRAKGSNIICNKYATVSDIITDKTISGNASNNRFYIIDSAYSDPDVFKTAMSGTYMVYKLATPTTEEADPYQETQICNDFGTEEFVVTEQGGVSVPVGSESVYAPNLRAKLEMAPNSPSGDGDYIVRQTSGQNAYVPLTFPVSDIPAAPTTDGNYVLKATVSDGTASLSWASE